MTKQALKPTQVVRKLVFTAGLQSSPSADRRLFLSPSQVTKRRKQNALNFKNHCKHLPTTWQQEYSLVAFDLGKVMAVGDDFVELRKRFPLAAICPSQEPTLVAVV